MRPPVREISYASTADGLAIAHWEIGSGPPLIYTTSLTFSHSELEWDVPVIAEMFLALSRHFRVIRFDPRGSGLSDDPAPDDLVPAAFARDIEAVADARRLDGFHLLACGSMGPVGITFAATRPQRVRRLILGDTFAVTEGAPLSKWIRAQSVLADLEVLPNYDALAPSEVMPTIEPLMAASMHDPGPVTRAMTAWDVRDRLADVAAPTLVVRTRSSVATDAAHCREIATGVADARLQVVDGTFFPFIAVVEQVVDTLIDFCAVPRDQETPATEAAGLRTIVFTDIVRSTELLQRLGDEAGRAAMRQVEEIVIELAEQHDGQVVKHLGDGSLVSFASTRHALSFGLDVQRKLEDSPLRLKIGMAAGEPILEDGDLHGAVVVQARRILDHCPDGRVLVADSVRQLAVGKGFAFDPAGEVELKGFEAPTKVYVVDRSDV